MKIFIRNAGIAAMLALSHLPVQAHSNDPLYSSNHKTSSAATTEWHIDGSVKVSGTKTFTISNLKLDYRSLFAKDADLTGGILGTVSNGYGSVTTSEMELSVYPYTGAGINTTENDKVYYFVSTLNSTQFITSSDYQQVYINSRYYFFGSSDIKHNAQKKNIYSPSGCNAKYNSWMQNLDVYNDGVIGGYYYSKNIKCSDASWYVTIVVKITDAYITKIKVPGLGEYTPLALFTGDAPTKIVEAYIDGSLQHTYSNAADAAAETLTTTDGQKINFKVVASGTSSSQDSLIVSGFPATWLARFAGEAMYWCTPSIEPGDFRPFLGFDAQIHGTALRRYPDGFITNENNWVYNGGDNTYSWSYIVQREMDPDKTCYTAQAKWNKQHTVGSVTQRRNQREGVNMQFLYAWPLHELSTAGRWNTDFFLENYYIDAPDGEDFAEGTDDDELFYFTTNGDGKKPSQVLFSSTSSDWKNIQDGETDCSLCDMVTAYKQQQYYVNGTDDNSIYTGHEIEDEGCVKATDDDGYVKVTNDYEISANYNFPAGNEDAAAASASNNKEPGQTTVFGFSIPIEAAEPVSVNYGFYGMIEGTQYPSVGEDATYKIKGLDPDKISDYYVVYDYEDEMGNLYSYKLSTASNTASNDAFSGKTAYLTGTGSDDDGSSNITVQIPILGGGYNTITVYYKDPDSDEGVMIGGKELLEVQLRFVSAYGSNESFTGDEATDDSDINEGKGDGAYIYMEEMRDNDDYPGSATDWATNVLDGWPNQSFVRRYTVPVDEPVTFGALDADPFTFQAYETEWYMSSRNIAKRISDDSLSDGKYLKWEVFELSNAYTGLNTNSYAFATGYGKTFSYTFTRTGTYCIRATYRGVSSVSHIVKVTGYSTVTDPIENVTDTTRGSIQVRDLTDQELAWLKEFDSETDFSGYKLAYVTDILSSYKYSNGYRAYSNSNLKNRFSYFNDYANEYVWKAVRASSNYNPLYNYDGTGYSDTGWFPKTWIRHNSEKAWSYTYNTISDPTGLTDLDDALYDTSASDINLSEYNLFTGQYANAYEPWQERLPWIALTTYYGSRIRTNIKALYSLDKMFDRDSGALTGNRQAFTTGNVYAAAAENPNLTGMTDDEKDKQKFFYDLKYKRKKLFDPAYTNSLTVYNSDPNSEDDDYTFIATTDLTEKDITGNDDPLFIKGMDLSTASNLYDAGVSYTVDGKKNKSIISIAKNYGANLVRLRLWVDPVYTAGTSHVDSGDAYYYNNYDDVEAAMQTAKDSGMKVLLALHLSDKWADPGDQIIPAAWADDFGDFDSSDAVAAIPGITNLYNDVYSYVYNLLDSFKTNTGYTPDYIQIGNEINTDILVDNSYAERVELKDSVNLNINWNRQADLLTAGLKAVQDFNAAKNTSVQTVLHTSGIEYLEYFAEKYDEYGLDYDVMGVSYYPNISMSSLDKVGEIIDTVYSKYGKQVLIAETGFPRTYNDAAGDADSDDEIANTYTSSNYGYGPLTTNYIIQRDWLLQLKTMLKARVDDDGNRKALGFVYWEPAWVANANSLTLGGYYGSAWDNMTFFEPDYSGSKPKYTLETDGGIQVFCNDIFCYEPAYSSSSSGTNNAKTNSGTSLPGPKQKDSVQDDKMQRLFIYPNPAADELHLRVKDGNGTYDVRLYDMNGRLMLSRQITQSTDLSLSGFANGIYLLQVHGPGFKQTAKIIIHK